MGRHAANTTRSLPRARIGTVLVALVVLGGASIWGFTRLNADASTGAAGNMPTSSTTPSVGNSPSPTPTAGSDSAAAARAALAACAAEVMAGQAVATAAAASARDWRMHASAQWQLDEGAISYAAAEKMWAESKKNGEADLADFARTSATFRPHSGGCRSVAAATAGSDAEAQGVACGQRATALYAVAEAGARVNGQWAAHIAQMKTKATGAGHAYHAAWLESVAAAKEALSDYDKAAQELAAAPEC